MIILTLMATIIFTDLPVPDCWPWWQCNGTKETNHPNCKCWDGK